MAGWAIDAGAISTTIMTTLGLVRDRRREVAIPTIYIIEYTSAEHRGIIMYSEACTATSPAGALAYARSQLSGIAAKYGARGCRVKDADGVRHNSEGCVPR